MSKRSNTNSPSPSFQRRVPKKFYTIMGPPAVPKDLEMEFDELWQMFREALQPADFIDEMYIRNAADLEMEVRNARKLKAALMASSRDSGLKTLLDKLGLQHSARTNLAEAWMRGEPSATKEVKALLGSAQMGADEIFAHTLANKIDVFEKVERMIAQAEARRNAHISELARHRSWWSE